MATNATPNDGDLRQETDQVQSHTPSGDHRYIGRQLQPSTYSGDSFAGPVDLQPCLSAHLSDVATRRSEQGGTSHELGVAQTRRVTEGHRFSSEVNRRLKPLYQLDNWHGVLAILIDLIWIAGSVLLYKLSPWFLPVALVIIGARQRGIADLLHHSSHGRLARSKSLNFILGTLGSGYWVFQTWVRYYKSHVERHHKYLGDAELDPDVKMYIMQGLFSAEARKRFWVKHALPTLLLLRVPKYLYYLVRYRLLPESPRTMSRTEWAEYAGFLIFWVTVIAGIIKLGIVADFVVLWVLPYVTTFQVIGWFIEVAEHYPLTASYSDDLRTSRNRLGNLFERLLTGVHHENYHLVHHLRPGIPWWNLRKAHVAMCLDPEYEHVARQSGGLFTNGEAGAPSILRQLISGHLTSLTFEQAEVTGCPAQCSCPSRIPTPTSPDAGAAQRL